VRWATGALLSNESTGRRFGNKSSSKLSRKAAEQALNQRCNAEPASLHAQCEANTVMQNSACISLRASAENRMALLQAMMRGSGATAEQVVQEDVGGIADYHPVTGPY
jgi:hypothetical protein